jgi:hypothetical protein
MFETLSVLSFVVGVIAVLCTLFVPTPRLRDFWPPIAWASFCWALPEFYDRIPAENKVGLPWNLATGFVGWMKLPWVSGTAAALAAALLLIFGVIAFARWAKTDDEHSEDHNHRPNRPKGDRELVWGILLILMSVVMFFVAMSEFRKEFQPATAPYLRELAKAGEDVRHPQFCIMSHPTFLMTVPREFLDEARDGQQEKEHEYWMGKVNKRVADLQLPVVPKEILTICHQSSNGKTVDLVIVTCLTEDGQPWATAIKVDMTEEETRAWAEEQTQRLKVIAIAQGKKPGSTKPTNKGSDDQLRSKPAELRQMPKMTATKK